MVPRRACNQWKSGSKDLMECYQGWRGVVTKLFGKFGVYALANVGNTVGLSCSNSFDISEMSHLDICEVFIFKYFTECGKKNENPRHEWQVLQCQCWQFSY